MSNPLSVPTITDVSITHELARRAPATADYLREKIALQDLARAMAMADHPEGLLSRLVELAMEICDADSAGISVLDGDLFRWRDLAGKLKAFEGATTPRNHSPCGICIDNRSPTLMERPERVYGWISDANITVPEVLLVPLLSRATAIGTLWIVAHEGQQFDSGHERVMTELAAFTGIALNAIQSDLRLKKALQEQETLAHEMSHRVKNLLAITEAMVRQSAKSARTKEEMTDNLVGRLHALAAAHGLVRRSFNADLEMEGVDLRTLVELILRPHRPPKLTGPNVRLGERATNNVAMVFHELATNASKYGAFLNDRGSVAVSWKTAVNILILDWREDGGPKTEPPAKKGFGSTLVEATIASLGGTLAQTWRPDGLSVHITLPVARLAA